MTGSGLRNQAWRRRSLLMAMAMMTSLLSVPLTWLQSAAVADTQMTLLYHGAVTGKIAPCG